MVLYKMYSLYNCLIEYEKNKDIIKAYYSNNIIENYKDINPDNINPDNINPDENISPENRKILGLTIGVFVTLTIIQIILSLWAIIAIVYFSKQLPTWIIVVASGLLLLPGGAIVSLILVYIFKDRNVLTSI